MLDATRCLSTVTQAREPIAEPYAGALEDRVYGCDICQDVCPWNAGPARRGADLPPEDGAWVSLADWLELPGEELLARHAHLYVPERDPRYLQRNALIALGNGGDPAGVELARRYAASGDPLLAEPARRALERLG